MVTCKHIYSLLSNVLKVKHPGGKLPSPCPLPTAFSQGLKEAIKNNNITGNTKLKLIREACEYYQGICPYPTVKDYDNMARTLCSKFPQLANKQVVKGSNWVSLINTFNEYLLYTVNTILYSTLLLTN
jgi:hypothetical protein